MAFTRPPPLGRPRCAAQAGPGARTSQVLPRGLQPRKGTGNKGTHTHCELSAPAGAARGPSDLWGLRAQLGAAGQGFLEEGV